MSHREARQKDELARSVVTREKEGAMDRRWFLQVSAGAVATRALNGHSRSDKLDAFGSPLSSRQITASEFHKTRRFAATPHGRIAYVELGGGQAALFLHGFPLNSFQWHGVLNRLSAHGRCIAPDFMGLGYTQLTEGQNVGPDAQVRMLVALLDKLSISTVDLIANDSGGAIAQLFVTQHPGRVRTLLLTNCDTEPDSPPPAVLPVIEMARAGTYPDLWLVPWLADKVLARSKKGIGGMCYSHPNHPTDEAIECYFAPLVRKTAG
jgi:haloalkane dehalogenase